MIFALLRSYSLCIRCYDESSDLACYHQDSLGNKANYDYLTKFIKFIGGFTGLIPEFIWAVIFSGIFLLIIYFAARQAKEVFS